MRFSRLLIGLFYGMTCHHVLAKDLIKDTSTMNQLRSGINHVYNCEFTAAENTLNYLQESYPAHPVTPFFEGLIYYWKYYPLMPGDTVASEFEEVMEKSWKRSRSLMEEGNEIEGVFFDLMSRAFIVMYYADNGKSSKAISHLGKIYKDIMASFELQSKFNEFYFITGLYDYYREAYPEAHPVYKPAAIFFRRGDKSKGLQMLRFAAENTVFMRVEASLFLSLIYINYENNVDSALWYALQLHLNYPNNGYFLSKYTEMLLADKQYDKALDQILSLMGMDDYNKMKGIIFMGIYEEKRKDDPEKSRILYEEGLRLAEAYEERADYMKAYAYIGLSRYFEGKGDMKQARSYWKKAKNASSYDYYY
jgi:tetratricopeptide (TPR) repeat protein